MDRSALVVLTLLVAIAAGGQTAAFDFQPAGAAVENGFIAVTPADYYGAPARYGFVTPPRTAIDGSQTTWTFFGRTVTVDEALPTAVLSDATRDCVASPAAFTFLTDVPPGVYDVTLWLGNVTTPTFQVRAIVNDQVIDVERMDVNTFRGSFDQTVIGNAVPRTVRVTDNGGRIAVTVGPAPSTSPVVWEFTLDQCPTYPEGLATSAVVVPAFVSAGLQAVTIHPAANPPLALVDGSLTVVSAPEDPGLAAALTLFNAGDAAGALAAFRGLADDSLRLARAAGILWVAGHPATISGETALLVEARTLIQQQLAADPEDWSARDLLLAVSLAEDAERYRAALGYGGTPAAENLGRSCSIVEQFQPDHPYYLKGRILWLRNRGGLDPRRCTVSWERAQDLALQLDPQWGAVNPYVHLYATDSWSNDGDPWFLADWGTVAGPGPEWARTLVRALNVDLDLSEWWITNRQNEIGEIGGGWTDDVELVGLFGLVGYLLEGTSELSTRGAIKLADGIWGSGVIDQERGFEAAYADVEHSAEPTGDSLHLYPMLRYGDPEGLERIMRNAKTFAELFLTTTGTGHRHFRGNHMSATEIGLDPDHRSDIPLNGRAVAPLPWLVWYSGHPAATDALETWTRSWVADAGRTDKGKPAGVFPNAVVVEPTEEEIGIPGGDWYSAAFDPNGIWGIPDYQYFLYNLAAFFALRTGDAEFLAPFDAAVEYGLEYVAAGRPDLGDVPEPGEERIWCGDILAPTASRTLGSLASAAGIEDSDWQSYLQAFATSYARYRLDPTDETPLQQVVEPVADTLEESWPYRTTEGVMTDRVAVPGIGDVISYYLGADVYSVYFGLPLPTVTWSGSGRLLAAAVAESTRVGLAATLYLFEDQARWVGARFWGLDVGGSYLLEIGPAPGLGADATTVTQAVPFTLTERGERVMFALPGRTVVALRVTQTAAAPAPAGALPDLAVAPRDIAYNAASGVLSVRVHNIGAAAADNVAVTVRAGGQILGSTSVPSLPSPDDLVPSSVLVSVPVGALALPVKVTCEVDAGDVIAEITSLNNASTVILGAPRAPRRAIAAE